MIKGVHTMFYSSRPGELRAFLRDKLGLNKFTDTGDGWLIFDLPAADLGVHPTDDKEVPSGTADISFYCDDIHTTVNELRSRGVDFIGEVEERGFGHVIYFKMPGDFQAMLYQPKYEK